METQQEEYIKCSGCSCRRHIDEFELYKGKRRKNCMKCKAKNERRKEYQKEYNKQWRTENKDYDKQYQQNNKQQILEQRKQYRIDNKDKVKQQQKKYREENRQQILDRNKQHYEENKCEHNKGKGQCSICNPQMYLINLQRSAVKRVLKQGNLTKTKHTIEYLGCDSEYFTNYIKNKMTDEMTFNNIHIDHIKPVSAFNLENEDEFLDCCHYTNLQPLLAQDNLEKHDKWSDENESYWNDNIRGKETTEIYYSWK